MERFGQNGGCTRGGRFGTEWCFACYENKKGKTNWRGHLAYRAPPEVRIDPRRAFMKRPDSAASRPGHNFPPRDGKSWEKWPLLYEHLSHCFWEDAKARTVSTLTVFCEDGAVKIALNDRENECSLFVSGDTIQACLSSLEKRLDGSSAADWRAWGKRKKG